MSTVAQVVTAWEDKIWNHDSIQELCNRIYNFDVLNENSESEDSKLYFDNEINFVVYKVSRSPKQEFLTGGRQYNYQVTIDYYLEVKPLGDTHQRIHAFFEALDAVYYSELTHNWFNTITDHNNVNDVIDAQTIQLDSRNCLKASVVYSGYKWFVE